jgi:uncharacterized cupredoxin-like copper-binding protein
MRTYRAWPVLAIAAASVILGLTATVVTHAGGWATRPPAGTGYVSYPNGSAVWGQPMMGAWRQYPAAALCPVPALPGSVVHVNLTDMGAMMGPWGRGMMGRAGMMGPRVMPGMGMMRILVYPTPIPAGQVSLRVINSGALSHELVVLPLAPGQLAGQRLSGADGRVDESGSLGEVSRTCGPDKGDEQSPDYGIVPQGSGWTTLSLTPGRYELICNIAGHYVAGMSAELDVTGAPQ